MWLTPENLTKSFYADATLEYVADGRIRTINAKLPLLPQASHSFASPYATDSWVMHHLSNPRTYTLTTKIKTQVGPAESPIVTLSDFGPPLQTSLNSLNVRVDYAQPVEPGGITADGIVICPELSNYSLQQRSLTYAGISITTRFYYANWESMILTYPLAHFIDTTITGLTTQPIVLHGYYSQTFHPFHHNFGEEFLFEPQLEPGILQTILDQLKAQNIRLIYLSNSSISTLADWETPYLVADIDGNGTLDFADFAWLGSRWFETVCDDCDDADLTGDGEVDLDDLFTLSQQWLDEL
jgi:hypothetical protein